MTPEAFRHLPHLRGRIVPPDESQLRVTLPVLAMWDERARALGRPEDWRLPLQEIEASRQATLGRIDPAQDLWVYAYGSLMSDPGLHFDELRLADLPGYQRRFSFRTTMGRGAPECPGLMLSIEPRPGCCRGLAFRIAGHRVEEETAILWRREMIRGSYCPALLPVATPQGPVTALVFTSNPAHADHVAVQTLAEAAAIIAKAAGVLGTNIGYLEQLVAQLQALDIEDDYILRLLAQVHADERT